MLPPLPPTGETVNIFMTTKHVNIFTYVNRGGRGAKIMYLC